MKCFPGIKFQNKFLDFICKHSFQINFSGECPNCQNNLERFSLKQDEFDQLRDAFVNKVVYEDDIEFKTSEMEFDAFKKFIHKNAPFDYVIDGLNIAYKNPKRIEPKNVCIENFIYLRFTFIRIHKIMLIFS